MEMPSSCEKCGEVFELLDGLTSKKWFPNTIICESCGTAEEEEIDRDEEIAQLKEDIAEAEYTLLRDKARLAELEATKASSSPSSI